MAEEHRDEEDGRTAPDANVLGWWQALTAEPAYRTGRRNRCFLQAERQRERDRAERYSRGILASDGKRTTFYDGVTEYDLPTGQAGVTNG